MRATCIASQVPFELWHEQVPDPTVADAVMDRLIHIAHKIEMQGESMRKMTNSLPMSKENGM